MLLVVGFNTFHVLVCLTNDHLFSSVHQWLYKALNNQCWFMKFKACFSHEFLKWNKNIASQVTLTKNRANFYCRCCIPHWKRFAYCRCCIPHWKRFARLINLSTLFSFSVYGLFLSLMDPWLKRKKNRYTEHSNEEVTVFLKHRVLKNRFDLEYLYLEIVSSHGCR